MNSRAKIAATAGTGLPDSVTPVLGAPRSSDFPSLPAPGRPGFADEVGLVAGFDGFAEEVAVGLAEGFVDEVGLVDVVGFVDEVGLVEGVGFAEGFAEVLGFVDEVGLVVGLVEGVGLTVGLPVGVGAGSSPPHHLTSPLTTTGSPSTCHTQ